MKGFFKLNRDKKMEMSSNFKGFTLIELLISVAIVAILAAVAMAAYSIFVTQSRRSDATTAIKTIQFAEENYRANNTTYGTLAQVGGSSTSSNGFYTISVSGASATGYTIIASPVTGTSQASDSTCSPIQLVQSGATTTMTPTACWSH